MVLRESDLNLSTSLKIVKAKLAIEYIMLSIKVRSQQGTLKEFI